jgi:endonuclease-3
MALLFAQHPNAFTELDFRNAFELLTATILSAQSTDRGVNLATPALFAKYPDARALAKADAADVEVLVKTTGFFRQKAKAIMGMAAALVREHGGQVPADMDALTQLPGVGRKTANVVLGHALGVPGMPVDRHVLRVANRIGIAHAATPEEVETQLCAAMPREKWTLTSDTLILHGRRICRPDPLCDQCAVVELCDFAREWGRTAAGAATGSPGASARKKAKGDGAPSRGAASGKTRRAPEQDAASARSTARTRAGAKPAAASRTKRPAVSHAGHPATSHSTSRKTTSRKAR